MIKISRPHLRFTLPDLVFFFLFFSFLCILLGFLSGCSPRRPLKEPPEPIDLGRVLVMPFQDLQKTMGMNSSFRCPFLGSMHEVGRVKEGAAEFLTDRVFTLLDDEKKVSLIEPGQALGARSAILSESIGELTERELVMKIGRNVEAQSVVVGRIFQYREREGTAYSVETPASVAFDIILLRVSDGQVLWADHFVETQKALSENLFLLGTFIRRGGKWLTADELADFGLKQVFKTFPDPL